jgi:hypothetical protein
MARHRRRLPPGVDQSNLDMKNADRLAGPFVRDDEEERRENGRSEHQIIVAATPLDVNGATSRLDIAADQ